MMTRARATRGARSRAWGIALALLAVWPSAALRPARAAEPRTITFRQAVEIALAQNTALQRADNQTTLDRLAVRQARMRFLPDLRFGVSGSESFDRNVDPDTGKRGFDTSRGMSAGLSSGVTLFDGLANVADLHAARLEEQAGQLDAERTRQTVVFDVISGYLTMIEASEQLRVRQENLAAQLEQEQLVQKLVDGGQRPISDLYQQQANVASARLSLVQAQRADELGRIDLVQALQLDPTGDYTFAIPPLPAVTAEAAQPDLESLLAQAFAQRPDLSALTAQQAAAAQGLRAAKGGRWPSLSLSAGYSGRYSSGSEGDLFDQLNDHQGGSVGLSLSLPIFDRFAVSTDIQRARINLNNFDLAVADLHQDVALQVRRAVLDRDAAQEQLRAAEAQVRAARQALDATGERYAAGAATLYEVTLSRADFTAATSAEVGARYNLLWQEQLIQYYVGNLDPKADLGMMAQ